MTSFAHNKIRVCIALMFLTAGPLTAETAPYAGQDARDIATLSAQDVEDLLAGRGWGFALAAELNGYPGPAHVLDLADELELDDSQRLAVQAVFDAMNVRARTLGSNLVDAEAALSRAFDADEIDPDRLQALVNRSAEIEAELRAVHLAAHLEIKPLMSRHQIMLYDRARGYGSGSDHGAHTHD